ncbi:Methyltransferase psoC [Colletotrichum sp. SAR 10_70]|nr:Methyltransferase psoC [Colletotrichum sp. SAR 10_71]KAI8175702.1 Methyltransferase psoC [Colletotrichum sp. SAR 10_75]KAI8201810.1 Methyltransferase psoC [Colletotrichum sp. SAR 10_70]KAI8224152.1 Methyltransferase psoC [Colletotrichum sp. SAR 10_77]
MSDQHDPEYLLRETKREIERLRKQHQWFQGCLDNKIVFAPVDLSDPSLKVLDVGCADETLAPGGWLQIQEMDLSAGRTEHPSAFNEVLQLFEAVFEAGAALAGAERSVAVVASIGANASRAKVLAFDESPVDLSVSTGSDGCAEYRSGSEKK